VAAFAATLFWPIPWKLNWFDERLQIITPQSAQKDAKTRLQEWLQARKFELPTYQVTQVEGLAPKQTFEVTCELEQMQQTFKAQGASRRKAEQQVAATVLSWLEQQYD
jgi:ribonuclease III